MTEEAVQERPVLTERRGKTLIVTLNRPQAGNSVNPDVTYAMETAFNMAEADPEVYAVILTAAGDRIFCGGADLKHVAANGTKGIATEENGFAGLTKRWFPKPLIAAVNGAALGGGTELALCCDIIISSETATFGLPECKRGLLAAAGGPIRLPRSVPRAIAMEMMLTGDAITAARALEIGMINQVVAPDGLMDAAMAMAERIVGNAPLSVRGAKELACKSYGEDIASAFERSQVIAARVHSSEDFKEGPRAFAEKRPPVWKGR